MSRSRIITLGVVIAVVSVGLTALVLLLLGGVLFPGLASRGDRDATSGGVEGREVVFDSHDTVPILVALQDMPRGFVIPSDAYNNAVGVREWPRAAVPVSAIVIEQGQDPAAIIREQVVGRILFTDVKREQPLLQTILVSDFSQLAQTGSDTAVLLPSGKVAISVPINEVTGTAFGLQPGDHISLIFSFVVVDVDQDFQTALPNWVFEVEYGSIEDGARTTAAVNPLDGAIFGRIDTIPPGELANIVPSELQRPRLVSQLTVGDALVLHVGEYPPGGEILGVDPAARADSGLPYEQPTVVTLGVSPQEAVVITWAINARVNINLVIRSVAGVSNAQTSSVTLQYIFETYNVTVPPRLTYSLEPSLRQPPAPEADLSDDK